MSWFVEHLHRDGTVLARLPMTHERFTIGRALDNDLVLDDPHAAAHHAEITAQGNHRALLKDLGSVNGIASHRGKRSGEISLQDPQVCRVGASHIRVRSSAWPLVPEVAIASPRTWLWAILLLLAVLGHSAWEVWVEDRQSESPAYLYVLAGVVGVLALWSAAYALYGRLINGADRFASHLLIACGGYLGITVLDNLLNGLAFASGWVWPLQWSPYLLGLALALTVRAHLRTADPRHWPSTRWALGTVTLAAMAVPLAQQWISNKEFTSVHTMDEVNYPMLRLAKPTTIDAFLADVQTLKEKSDAARAEKAQVENESEARAESED